jgi:catechol 2,3-dioxygenase-like lactoylglutathione lyase family enzyme
MLSVADLDRSVAFYGSVLGGDRAVEAPGAMGAPVVLEPADQPVG